jgi:hypothetical protein
MKVTKGVGAGGKRKEGFFSKALLDTTEDMLYREILPVDSYLVLIRFPGRGQADHVGPVGDFAAEIVLVVPEGGFGAGKMTDKLAVGGENVGCCGSLVIVVCFDGNTGFSCG